MKAYLYPAPPSQRHFIPVRTMPFIRLRAKTVRDTLKRQLHDAGRQGAGFGTERNDCTVRALATAANIPYAEAHQILKLAGRKPGQGIVFSQEAREKRFEGFSMESIHVRAYDGKARTVAQVLRSGLLSKGRFILLSRNHAWALVDGVVHDSGATLVRPRTRVIAAYRPVPI